VPTPWRRPLSRYALGYHDSLFELGLLLGIYDDPKVVLKPLFGAVADCKGAKPMIVGELPAFALVSASSWPVVIPPSLACEAGRVAAVGPEAQGRRPRPLDHARGLHYRGPWRLPGSDSHRLAVLNLWIDYVTTVTTTSTPCCRGAQSAGRTPDRASTWRRSTAASASGTQAVVGAGAGLTEAVIRQKLAHDSSVSHFNRFPGQPRHWSLRKLHTPGSA